MSFHESAADIRVKDGHILKAVLNNVEGDGVDAEINLNDIVGNENSVFVWGGINFADSAKDISFNFKGD